MELEIDLVGLWKIIVSVQIHYLIVRIIESAYFLLFLSSFTQNVWRNHILFVLLPMDEKNIDSTCFHNN